MNRNGRNVLYFLLRISTQEIKVLFGLIKGTVKCKIPRASGKLCPVDPRQGTANAIVRLER